MEILSYQKAKGMLFLKARNTVQGLNQELLFSSWNPRNLIPREINNLRLPQLLLYPFDKKHFHKGLIRHVAFVGKLLEASK